MTDHSALDAWMKASDEVLEENRTEMAALAARVFGPDGLTQRNSMTAGDADLWRCRGWVTGEL
jgi:hypothetical protein